MPGSAAFTLTELIVVVVLISLLFTVVFLRVGTDQGDDEVVKKEMRQIHKAILGDERTSTGFYHETRTEKLEPDDRFTVPPHVSLLVSRDTLEQYFTDQSISYSPDLLDWDHNHRRGYRPGGYIKGDGLDEARDPYFTVLDPWGTAYVILEPDTENARIVSYGPDKIPGNADDPQPLYLFLAQ
jgi:hypothetical protein